MQYAVLGWIAIQVLAFVLLIGLGLFIFDRRYKRKRKSESDMRPDPGFVPTAECFIDPKDGLRYRVYYNPRTGERDYIREE